jgi:hypothetical protein
MLRTAKVKNSGPKRPNQTGTVAARVDESLRSFKRLSSLGSAPGSRVRNKIKSDLENLPVARLCTMTRAIDWDPGSRWPRESQVAGPLGP